MSTLENVISLRANKRTREKFFLRPHSQLATSKTVPGKTASGKEMLQEASGKTGTDFLEP